MYYTARVNSPVYSLVFNSGQLFCALDSGVHCLNFSLWLADFGRRRLAPTQFAWETSTTLYRVESLTDNSPIYTTEMWLF